MQMATSTCRKLSVFSDSSFLLAARHANDRVPQSRRMASLYLTSDLSAFCYCRKMQLGTLACGKQSFARLVAGKKRRWQCVMVTSCIWSFHLHFEHFAKCKWFLWRSVISGRKTNWVHPVTCGSKPTWNDQMQEVTIMHCHLLFNSSWTCKCLFPTSQSPVAFVTVAKFR